MGLHIYLNRMDLLLSNYASSSDDDSEASKISSSTTKTTITAAVGAVGGKSDRRQGAHIGTNQKNAYHMKDSDSMLHSGVDKKDALNDSSASHKKAKRIMSITKALPADIRALLEAGVSGSEEIDDDDEYDVSDKRARIRSSAARGQISALGSEKGTINTREDHDLFAILPKPGGSSQYKTQASLATIIPPSIAKPKYAVKPGHCLPSNEKGDRSEKKKEDNKSSNLEAPTSKINLATSSSLSHFTLEPPNSVALSSGSAPTASLLQAPDFSMIYRQTKAKPEHHDIKLVAPSSTQQGWNDPSSIASTVSQPSFSSHQQVGKCLIYC